jgi:predicted Zn-dependent protease with MMP-like domain
MSEQEEEYDYHREPEPDSQTIHMHKNRSRYFFAMMSFLIALLFLSIYLNNYHDFISGWLLLLGIIAFGALGALFLSSTNVFHRTINTRANFKGNDSENSAMVKFDEEPDEREDFQEDDLSPFERLVKEALATIPPEFHDQMENVLVRVQYEPGEEVMERVGMKEGYTLLGLYEGVPLTTYGQARVPHPEIITIYQRTIESYCHGDPDRIREQVRHTVLHEVAHHFGIDHEEMPIWIR